MLQLTDNLHQFHQQGDPAETLTAMTEFCYGHNIEILNLEVRSARYSVRVPGRQPSIQYGPYQYYSQLNGQYNNSPFSLMYNAYNYSYSIYIDNSFVDPIDTCQQLLTTLQRKVKK